VDREAEANPRSRSTPAAQKAAGVLDDGCWTKTRSSVQPLFGPWTVTI